MFDFKILERQIRAVYPLCSTRFTLDEVIAFFKGYITLYKEYMGKEHPYIKSSTIKDITDRLSDDGNFDYDLETYQVIVPKYFEQTFSNCDYSINHFMSGDIRMLRYYECCY